MKNFIYSLLILLIFGSCASIVSQSNWPLSINTKPSGAKVEITNKFGQVILNHQTPVNLALKSGAGFFAKESYKIKLTLDGYPEKIIPVECKLNGWYVGNILFGGLIGLLIVDPATGAMYKLDRKVIDELFTKSDVTQNPSLKVWNINDIPDDMKDHLVSVK